MTTALIVRRGTEALANLGVDDLADLRVRKSAPFRFCGAETGCSTCEMLTSGRGSPGSADRYRLRVVDRRERRPQRRCGRYIT